MTVEAQCKDFRDDFTKIRQEIAKMIVGHDEIVEGVLTCMFLGGHALLEGVPGLGKTLLIRTLSDVLSLQFSRIQFTPDLMPADILGTNIIMESEGGGRELRFQKGPIFAQVILADEVNRATPKTQSALLETMQEHSVTIGGETRILEEPFFVMATQNPLEMEGTYPLPEAQLDRFLMKLMVEYSNREELKEILTRTTDEVTIEMRKVIAGAKILEHRDLIKRVVIAPHVKDYAVRIVLATHPGGEFAADITNKYIRYGASPRGAQALVSVGKVKALLAGRYNVSYQDIEAVALPSLRHRLILNFEGEAEGVMPGTIIKNLLENVSHEAEAVAR